jgi:hypothetical protein
MLPNKTKFWLAAQELYERDVRMVSSRLSDALNSCTNDQLGQGQHPSSSAEDWQYAFLRMHKELRKLQRTINSLRLMEGYYFNKPINARHV